jgi:hypothetical protein
LVSPELMNWSITTCAPFAKSPNCAFPDDQRVGSAVEKPYSKPSTASSDSTESMTTKSPWSLPMCCSGM